MPINFQRSSNGTLYDPDGKVVGKIDVNGQVRDGWHDKGIINNDGTYQDEFGRDRGWTVHKSNGNGVGGGLVLIAIMLIFAFIVKIFSSKKGRRIAGRVGIILLITGAVMGVGALILKGADSQKRNTETEWILANPESIITISRLGDAPCGGDNCQEKLGIYTVKSNLTVMNVTINGWCYFGLGTTLGPGQSDTNNCQEELYGKLTDRCLLVNADGIDIGKVCYK